MSQNIHLSDGLSYSPCRYGDSRIYFRGPKCDLSQPYLAFLGGTETFGKFIPRPFPSLVAETMNCRVANFGCVNGGVDAFIGDTTIMEACSEAKLTVVQLMGAQNLSNRFYAVHPRRNDRFLRASTVLQAIYHDVDFSEFTFTRHMLGHLYALSADRFDIVVNELREAWLARMRTLLGEIGPRTVLLWFARDELSNRPWQDFDNPIGTDPLFITSDMVDQLQEYVLDVVAVRPSIVAVAEGTQGMVYPAVQLRAAEDMLSVRAHTEAASLLAETLKGILEKNEQDPPE